MLRTIAAVVLSLLACASAFGQAKTPTQIINEINLFFPDQSNGQINPANTRTTLIDIANSYLNQAVPLAPGQVWGNDTLATGPAVPTAGVDTNSPRVLAVSGSIGTTDCGRTLQLGTGSTGFLTLTVPAVTGFPPTCSVRIVNGDTGRGKAVAGLSGIAPAGPCAQGNGTATSCILWPQKSISIKIVSGAWTIADPAGLWAISSAVTWNVDPINGSDSNDGLAAGAGNAFQTIQHCVDTIANNVFMTNTASPTVAVGATPTCKLVDGTYTESVQLKQVSGSGDYTPQLLPHIVGNTTTPANVAIKGNGAGSEFDCASVFTPWFITGIALSPTSSGDVGFAGDENCHLTLGTFSVTAPITAVMVARYKSWFELIGGSTVTIAANISSTFAEAAQEGNILTQQGITGVFSGSPTVAVMVIVADRTSAVDISGISWSGSVTAAQFSAFGGNFGGMNPSNLPGTPGGWVDIFYGGNQGGIPYISSAPNASGIQTVNSSPTLNQNGVVYGGGLGAPASTQAGTNNQVFVGNTGAAPSWVSITGCTLSSGTLSCPIGSGVPQNNLNAQTTNYTVHTTDCGKTVSMSGGFLTVTLPSVAGFASNCVLSVYNADSTRGKALSGFPGAVSASPTNVLWQLDTLTVEIVNGAWSIQAYPVRHKLTGSITVNVDGTNGSDSNDCLATTTGACATIQGALNYVSTWDTNSQAINISVADGTYTGAVTVTGPWHGAGTVTLTGDVGTPANCVISTTGANAITVQSGANLTIAGGFKITTTTSGVGILATTGAFVNVTGAMNFGATAAGAPQIQATQAGQITITANYTISGSSGGPHWTATTGGVIRATGRTITLTGTPTFGTAFANVSSGGLLVVSSNTFSGSSGTAQRYNAAGGGQIFTGQTSGTYFPGTTAGVVVSGGKIDGPGIPVATSCGTSPGTAAGTDFSGSVTEGTSATGCTITFASASTITSCGVNLSSGTAIGISTLGATLVVTHASVSSNVLYWTCTAN